MQHLLFLRRARVTLLGLCVIFSVLSAQAKPLHYQVSVKGRHAGEAIWQVTQTEDRYEITLELHPIALAKILGIDDMTEKTSGTHSKGYYQPQYYQRVDMKGKSLLDVRFMPSQIQVKDKKGERQVQIPKAGQDPLTEMLQLQSDYRANRLQPVYHLVTESSVRAYHAVQKGQQIQLTTEDKKRQLILWFDKNGAIKRMQKIKNGNIEFDMQQQAS